MNTRFEITLCRRCIDHGVWIVTLCVRRVAIVVVNYNTRGRFSQCPHSLSVQDISQEGEIVVVDIAPTHGSIDKVRRAFPDGRRKL